MTSPFLGEFLGTMTLIVLGEAGEAARRYRVNRALLALSAIAVLGTTLAIGFVIGAHLFAAILDGIR